MRRSLGLLVVLVCFAGAVRGDEAIPPDTVTAVKHATVYLRVQGTTWKATGSGFVVAADKDSVLVATNYHVVAPPDFEKKPKLTPAEFAKSLKASAVTAVFDSGTKAEVAAKAEVIAADPENDLAVLRITGLKDPPKPIAYADPPKLSETMPVFTFGYPLGDALAVGKGSPAITVGKGSVSSLRNDDDGELKLVQIDASLNPGNSGGPVVDAKGRLVGVVVSGFKGAQGLNFAVPCPELGKLMKGRLDGLLFTATKGADGKLTVRAEVGVLDPTSAVRGVTLHYFVVPPKGAKPKAGELLSKHPSSKSALLKVAGGVATGEFTLDGAEGDLYVQAVPDGGAGVAGASRVRDYGLQLPKAGGAVVLGAPGAAVSGAGAGEVPPPAGWKEYTAANKTFMIWLPEKSKGQSEKERTSGTPQLRFKFSGVLVEMTNGPIYLVEQVIISPPQRNVDRDELTTTLRDAVLGDNPGAKITREVEAKMGRFTGKEYFIERGANATRARIFVIGSSIYVLRVIGTRVQADSAEGAIFLDSCRLQVLNRPPVGGPVAIAGGGVNDPEFKDLVPAGAALVGLEINLGKFGPNTILKAVRPVYRVGDKDTTGEWYGITAPDMVTETVKLVAKPGYAIGAITAKSTPFFVGLSVTYMKLADGKLDPKDSYESDWVGNKDAPSLPPITVGGKGEVALGLIGKTNVRGTSGIGLLYKETEKKGPDIAGPVDPMNPVKPAGVGAVIAGGRTDPEFKDPLPAGGTLVGLEIGTGKLGPNTVVKAARAVFLVGDKESFGPWHGPTGADIVTDKVKLVAKPGYAVGGLNVRTGGAGVFGLSITFMKIADGKLDANDNYESDWVGAAIGLGPVKVGHTGEAAQGFAGKKNAETVSGLGLLYKDTTKKEPDKKGPDIAVGPIGPQPVRPGERGPRIHGGIWDPEHRDHAPAGGALVGFEVGLGKFVNNDVVKAIRPIYRVGDKDTLGEQYGTDTRNVVRVVAKPGYAVATVSLKTGLGIDGLSVTFMKLTDGKLDPKDGYESEWIGGKGGGGPVKIGDGTLVVGILVKANAKDVNALGLIYSDTNKPGLDAPWPVGKPTRMQGGGGDPEFREAGPADSLLVGLEVGVGRFFDNPIVVTARPIFRTGEKDTEGEWHGAPKPDAIKEVVKVVAKPGYAVGAITVKTGLGVDGLSVTFMKVVDGKLDPKDSYESDWVGGKGGGGPVTVGGDGSLVIGLIGKARADAVSGLGLLNPADKK